MRRKDLEISDKNIIEEILSTNTVCRIALVDGDEPYMVPMSYGYTPDFIYMHAALEGKKLDVLEKNNRVCFEVSDSLESVTGKEACSFSIKYRSVIGFGRAEILTDPAEKLQGLQVVMLQHTGKSDWNMPAAVIARAAVIRITIDSITGKQNS